MSIKPVKIPGVGMRNVKTALAAAFCALVYYFVGRSPAFACIGAIFGMGSDMEDSRKNGGNRLFGTLIGGLLDADGAVTMDIPVTGSEAQIGIDLTGCKRFVKITGTVSFTGGTTPAATATYALALGDPAQEPVE